MKMGAVDVYESLLKTIRQAHFTSNYELFMTEDHTLHGQMSILK
jgi:hypothetical protein